MSKLTKGHLSALKKIIDEVELTERKNTRGAGTDYRCRDFIRESGKAVLAAVTGDDTRLRAAAQAVIDRWDTPLWKDVGPTADVINKLRDTLEGK